MGVPVVTLAGERHAGRVGASLLHRVGLERLVADDRDAYVAVAADLAADRAGVRFAVAATTSEDSAEKMQLLLQGPFKLDEFFPKILDLPENLTVQDLHQKFGSVGSERYRREIIRIEAALDGCEALSVSGSGH